MGTGLAEDCDTFQALGPPQPSLSELGEIHHSSRSAGKNPRAGVPAREWEWG